MKKLGAGALTLALMSGCFGRVGMYGPNPFAVAATVITVAAVSAALSTPPVIADVEYYDYGERPGSVWVNPRYVYVNGAWAWQAGYWQPERPGFYWVQGSWQPQGDHYVWVDGYWAEPRAGYIYVDGYWDWRDSGYLWIPGRWEVDRPGFVFVGGGWGYYGGHRVWTQGTWHRDDGRADWGRYRSRPRR